MPAYFWADEELETLREMASGDASPAAIAEVLGRSERSVKHKIRSEIGIRQPDWTRGDEFKLMGFAEARKTAAQAARALERTETSVKHKARRMGLTFAPGFSFNELAEHIGVSTNAVLKWARDLGVRKKKTRQGKSASLSIEEALVILDGILSGRVGENLDVPVGTVRKVRSDLQEGLTMPRRNPPRRNPKIVGWLGERAEMSAAIESPTPYGLASAVTAGMANHYAARISLYWKEELIDPDIVADFENDARKYLLSVVGELPIPMQAAVREGFTQDGEISDIHIYWRVADLIRGDAARARLNHEYRLAMGAQTFLWLQDEVVDRAALAKMLFHPDTVAEFADDWDGVWRREEERRPAFQTLRSLQAKAHTQGHESFLLIDQQADLAQYVSDLLEAASDSIQAHLERIDRIRTDALRRDYEERANAEREAGGYVDIDMRWPHVAVRLSDGSEYFFQGEEADMLVEEVPDWINAEDYILAMAQNW